MLYIYSMKTGYIYKITSPSNKIYIGSTINIKNRFNRYKRLDCKAQIRLYNSFLKYGFNNHNFEIVEESDIDLMKKRETYWGSYFNVLQEKGLNCRLPKDGEKYEFMSIETREKLAKAFKGFKHTNESKKKISIAHKGKILSEETKLKMKTSRKNYVCSEETKRKISEKNIGKKRNETVILKMSESRKRGKHSLAKKVINIKTKEIYDCLKDVSEKYKINYSTLRNWLSVTRTTPNKSDFKYLE